MRMSNGDWGGGVGGKHSQPYNSHRVLWWDVRIALFLTSFMEDRELYRGNIAVNICGIFYPEKDNNIFLITDFILITLYYLSGDYFISY